MVNIIKRTTTLEPQLFQIAHSIQYEYLRVASLVQIGHRLSSDVVDLPILGYQVHIYIHSHPIRS